MRARLFNHFMILVMILGVAGASLAHALVNTQASAKGENPFVWDERVKFKPNTNPKPDRRRTSRRKEAIKKGVEEAPRLTLKYQVLKGIFKGDEDAEQVTEQVIDPRTSLLTGEQVKLQITTNQDGFLYIIHQSKAFKGEGLIEEPRLIFPDPKIGAGENEIKANTPYTVPRRCFDPDDPKKFQDGEDCWFTITPPAGREVFTLIFSRDQITNLPGYYGQVSPALIERIKTGSSKSISSFKGRDGNVTYLQNKDLKDNEEIFADIELTHAPKEKDDPSARARALFVMKASDAMEIRILKDGVPVDPGTEFKAGDKIRVWFKSNFKGYAYLVNIQPNGQRCMVFPCSAAMSNRIDTVKDGYTFPSDNHDLVFDEEKGTEVLQVIMSRETIPYLDAAVKNKDCCDNERCCQLSATASSAADELASNSSKQQVGGMTKENFLAASLQKEAGGILTRGIILAPGKKKYKGSTFVAIEDDSNPTGNTLKPGQAAVFVIRLKHI